MRLFPTRRGLLLLLPLFAACRSSQQLQPEVLPFHVAVVPPRAAVVGTSQEEELPGELTEMQLELASEEVVQAISEELGRTCFARISYLGHADDASVNDSEYLQRALEAEADLIVEFDLRYDAQLFRDPTSTSWLNYPLFLTVGPTHWFVADQTYFADVELGATFYDVQALDPAARSLADPSARVLATSARFTDTELDFTERADSSTHYLLGCVLPSAHLARATPRTERAIHAAVVEGLRDGLVQAVQSRRTELVRAGEVAPMFIEPEELVVRREGDEVLVQGSVHLSEASLAGGVRELVLEAGAEAVAIEPGAGEAIAHAGHRSHPFEARVPLGEGSEQLRVEVLAGGRDRYVRSYTFELP